MKSQEKEASGKEVVKVFSSQQWDRRKLFSSLSESGEGFSGLWSGGDKQSGERQKRHSAVHGDPSVSENFIRSTLSRKAAFQVARKKFETLFSERAPIMTLSDTVIMATIAGKAYRAKKVETSKQVKLTHGVKYGHIRQSLLDKLLLLALMQHDSPDRWVDLVKKVIQCGADVNWKAVYHHNRTPLHLACHSGHYLCARYLMESGAIVDSKDAGGNTPLHLACGQIAATPNVHIVRLLLDHGASARADNLLGQTPLHLAMAHLANADVQHLDLIQNHTKAHKQDGSVLSSAPVYCLKGIWADYYLSRAVEMIDFMDTKVVNRAFLKKLDDSYKHEVCRFHFQDSYVGITNSVPTRIFLQNHHLKSGDLIYLAGAKRTSDLEDGEYVVCNCTRHCITICYSKEVLPDNDDVYVDGGVIITSPYVSLLAAYQREPKHFDLAESKKFSKVQIANVESQQGYGTVVETNKPHGLKQNELIVIDEISGTDYYLNKKLFVVALVDDYVVRLRCPVDTYLSQYRDGEGRSVIRKSDKKVFNVASLDLDCFLEALTDEDRLIILTHVLDNMYMIQNNIVQTLLNQHSFDQQVEELMRQDEFGKPAFPIELQKNWLRKNRKLLDHIYDHPLELGYDSEIFQEPRTFISIKSKWQRKLLGKSLINLILFLIFGLLFFFVASLRLNFLRYDVSAFESSIQTSFLLEEYNKNNNEAYMDVEKPVDWLEWLDQVAKPAMFDSDVTTLDPNNPSNATNVDLTEETLRAGTAYHINNPRLVFRFSKGMRCSDNVVDFFKMGVAESYMSSADVCMNNLPSIAPYKDDRIDLGFHNVSLVSELKADPAVVAGSKKGGLYSYDITNIIPFSDDDYGYTISLPSNKTERHLIFDALAKSPVLKSRNLRSMALILLVGNPSITALSDCVFVAENSVSGQFVPYYRFRTYVLNLGTDGNSRMLFILQILLYCCFAFRIVLYTINRINWAKHTKNRLPFLSQKFKTVKTVQYFLVIVWGNGSLTEFSLNRQTDAAHRRSEKVYCKWILVRSVNAEEFDNYDVKLLPSPTSKFRLGLWKSIRSIEWSSVSRKGGYGNCCFDLTIYHVFISALYMGIIYLHMEYTIVMSVAMTPGLDTDTYLRAVHRLNRLQMFSTPAYGLGIFLTVLELLTHLRMMPNITLLVIIVWNIVVRLRYYFILIVVIIASYVTMAHVSFNTERGVSSFDKLILESFSGMAGDYSMESIVYAGNEADMLIERIMLIIYVILMVVVLMNLTIAFMTQIYSEVLRNASSRLSYAYFEDLEHILMEERGFRLSHAAHRVVAPGLNHSRGRKKSHIIRSKSVLIESSFKDASPVRVSRVHSAGSVRRESTTLLELAKTQGREEQTVVNPLFKLRNSRRVNQIKKPCA
jgi:hypothetical protein